MSKQRDDFSEETKRKLACRVGYICSFPGCNAFTVGASMDKKDKVSMVGVAAHICAAAPGGPRYNEKMTKEERKSINNGIWMCQTHSKLIDTDENTYSVELLHKWKEDAEREASVRIANVNFFDSFYKNNGDDLFPLETVFDEMILEGNYSLLGELLSRYNISYSSKYDELILRYRCIYDIFCEREKLNKDIEKYILLPDKSGIDDLIKYCIIFLIKDELIKLKEYCYDAELKEITDIIINNEMENKIFSNKSTDKFYRIEDDYYDVIYKCTSYYVYRENRFFLKDANGDLFEPYGEGFFFSCIKRSFDIERNAMLKNNIDEDSNCFFIDNMKKINTLDKSLKIEMIEKLTNVYISETEMFNQLIETLDAEIMENVSIQSNIFVNKIINYGSAIDKEELMQFCINNDEYNPLLVYVSSMQVDDANTFLDEHQYLYGKSVDFISIKCSINSGEAPSIIKKYRTKYGNDFLFNCLDALYADGRKVEWIKANINLLRIKDIEICIQVFEKFQLYDELYYLANLEMSNDLIYRIVCFLQENNYDNKKIKKLYIKLTDRGYKHIGFFHNYGVVQTQLGEIEGAKYYFLQEYEIYNHDDSLCNYLQLRYQTQEYKDDLYLNHAKKIVKSNIQNLVGATLLKLNKTESRYYFLRSLLLNDNEDNNNSINGLFQACSEYDENEKIESVSENTICELNFEEETIYVALYNPMVLENIVPNKFANVFHCSVEDENVSDLLFSTVGDTVFWMGSKYQISNIDSFNHFYASFAMQKMIQYPDTIKITGTIEESIEKITKIMKDNSARTNDIISTYNEQDLQWPLPTLAKILGKNKLEVLEFLLFENKNKIRNNLNGISEDLADLNKIKFILSYDSIVILSLLNISYTDFEHLNILCPDKVKSQLISDIDTLISHIKFQKSAGVMIYDNEHLSMQKYDRNYRRNIYKHLNKLKNFVKKLPDVYSGDYYPKNIDFSEFVTKCEIYCENACLSVASQEEHCYIVSDLQFLYGIAELENINSIGICSFISLLGYDLKHYLKKCSMLSKLNFCNYFSVDAYNNAVGLIKTEEDSDYFISFLLYNDNKDFVSEYHSRVIFEMIRSIVLNNPKFIRNYSPLHNIFTFHFSRLYPEKYKEMVQDFVMNMKVVLTNDTGEKNEPLDDIDEKES